MCYPLANVYVTLHNYGKSPLLVGKSTTSTGPFSMSLFVCLPEGTKSPHCRYHHGSPWETLQLLSCRMQLGGDHGAILGGEHSTSWVKGTTNQRNPSLVIIYIYICIYMIYIYIWYYIPVVTTCLIVFNINDIFPFFVPRNLHGLCQSSLDLVVPRHS